MYRIFKKKGDLAARNTEGRSRRPRRQRPGLEALEGRQLLSLATQDFLVNSGRTANSQELSDNASSSNGMSVAVWRDTFSSTDRDIRAQLYNAQGLRRGNEILVELSVADQGQPKVAMDAAGNFVVIYQETASTFRTDIFAKLYDSNGAQVGDRIAIANSDKSEFDPDVAMDANGNFVVSYTEVFSATDLDIRAVRYNSSGTRIGFVTEKVSRTSDHDETNSTVAMSPDGRFDIAYQTKSHFGGSTALNLARYDRFPFGTLLEDGPILFAGDFTVFGLNPSVAMDNAGNAVVAYDTSTTGGPGGSAPPPHAVRAIRVSSSGAFSDITSVGFGHSHSPSVALSPTGGSYVVAYENDLIGIPGNVTVEVTEVSASDTRGLVFNLPAFPNNVGPAVSIGGSGKYLLTFTAGVGSADRNIHGRFGQLPTAPAAQNLTLTESIRAGQTATLSGQLVDADGDTNLWLTVDWGDGSEPEQSQPGLEPFALQHRYDQAGTYTVHVTWTDSTDLSNSWDLKLKVKKAK